jgi:hypothetical protein
MQALLLLTYKQHCSWQLAQLLAEAAGTAARMLGAPAVMFIA